MSFLVTHGIFTFKFRISSADVGAELQYWGLVGNYV